MGSIKMFVSGLLFVVSSMASVAPAFADLSMVSTNTFQWLAAGENGTLLGGSGSGVSKSADNGKTWTTLAPSASNQPYTSLTYTAADKTYWLGTQKGILYSTDAGATWAQTATGLLLISDEAYPISGITLTAGNTYVLSSSFGRVWTSRDRASWTNVSSNGLPTTGSPPFVSNRPVLAVRATLGNLLLAGTSVGVYASTNEGQTWALKGLNGRKVTDIQVTSDGNVLALAEGDGAYILSSGQNDFIKTSLSFVPTAIAADRSKLYAGGANGALYESSDGGATWRASAGSATLGAGTVNALVAKAGALYATTSKGTFFSPPTPSKLATATTTVTGTNVSITGTVSPGFTDVGKPGATYVMFENVALKEYYFLSKTKGWSRAYGTPYETTSSLQEAMPLSIVNNFSLDFMRYLEGGQLYIGYGRSDDPDTDNDTFTNMAVNHTFLWVCTITNGRC